MGVNGGVTWLEGATRHEYNTSVFPFAEHGEAAGDTREAAALRLPVILNEYNFRNETTYLVRSREEGGSGYGWMDGCMGGWMDGCMDGWMTAVRSALANVSRAISVSENFSKNAPRVFIFLFFYTALLPRTRNHVPSGKKKKTISNLTGTPHS